ncbi:MAG TPA: hypothetical protein VIL09_18670 [Microvirga sp.]
MIEQSSNVVPFRKAPAAPARHPKGLMESVYASGSVAIPADDVATKTAAVMLQALGFLVVEEILADGTPRRLDRGETRQALHRPWRLSKPGFGGMPGRPDGDGIFLKT